MISCKESGMKCKECCYYVAGYCTNKNMIDDKLFIKYFYLLIVFLMVCVIFICGWLLT